MSILHRKFIFYEFYVGQLLINFIKKLYKDIIKNKMEGKEKIKEG